MGGAHVAAVGDGRQPLYVGAEHFGHGLTLGLAQLGELLGDVGHRAVVLQDLQPRNPTLDMGGGGGVAGLGQRRGDPFGRRLHLSVGAGDRGRHIAQDRVDALARERDHRVLPADLPQLAHRGHRKIVVAVPELAAARLGELEAFRRPAPADLLPGRRGVRLGVAHLDQRVEVAAHACGRQAQPGADLPCGDRAGFHQQPDHCMAGAAFR